MKKEQATMTDFLKQLQEMNTCNYRQNILSQLINGAYIGIQYTKKGYKHYLINGKDKTIIRSDTSKYIQAFLKSRIKTIK